MEDSGLDAAVRDEGILGCPIGRLTDRPASAIARTEAREAGGQICVSSENAFRKLYAAWHMAGGGPSVMTK
jgi:hypothetical protein